MKPVYHSEDHLKFCDALTVCKDEVSGGTFVTLSGDYSGCKRTTGYTLSDLPPIGLGNFRLGDGTDLRVMGQLANQNHIEGGSHIIADVREGNYGTKFSVGVKIVT